MKSFNDEATGGPIVMCFRHCEVDVLESDIGVVGEKGNVHNRR